MPTEVDKVADIHYQGLMARCASACSPHSPPLSKISRFRVSSILSLRAQPNPVVPYPLPIPRYKKLKHAKRKLIRTHDEGRGVGGGAPGTSASHSRGTATIVMTPRGKSALPAGSSTASGCVSLEPCDSLPGAYTVAAQTYACEHERNRVGRTATDTYTPTAGIRHDASPKGMRSHRATVPPPAPRMAEEGEGGVMPATQPKRPKSGSRSGSNKKSTKHKGSSKRLSGRADVLAPQAQGEMTVSLKASHPSPRPLGLDEETFD